MGRRIVDKCLLAMEIDRVFRIAALQHEGEGVFGLTMN